MGFVNQTAFFILTGKDLLEKHLDAVSFCAPT